MDTHLIVAGHISQATNDTWELTPVLDAVKELPRQIGSARRVAADNGYFSWQNTGEVEERGMIPYLATGRQPHNQHWNERLADPDPPPEDPTPLEAMARRLKTADGKAFYGRHKATVETVFGIIKSAMGFREFLLRGLQKARGEWKLIQCAYNLKRMHALAQ